MTLNVISDLHCGYDEDRDEVVWNGKGVSNSIKKDCIYFLDDFLHKFNNIKNKITKEIHLEYQNCVIKSPDDLITNINFLIDYFKSDFNNQDDRFMINIYDISTQYMNEIKNHLDINIPLYNNKVYYALNLIYSSFIPEKLESADYLIVAGDLGVDDSYQKVYDDLKKKTEGKFKDIFYIKGNHDYWWFTNKYRSYKDRPNNINFDHRYIEEYIDNYVILGCTMWAPVRPRNAVNVFNNMNDYRYIPGLTSEFPHDHDFWEGTEKITQLYKEESEWLRSKVKSNKDKKIIIVTHNLPRKELVDGKYSKSIVNDAYCVMDNSCDDIKPSIWIHGHSHSYYDNIIDNVRYIRNPIGYREMYGYVPSEVQPTHWYNTIVEI